MPRKRQGLSEKPCKGTLTLILDSGFQSHRRVLYHATQPPNWLCFISPKTEKMRWMRRAKGTEWCVLRGSNDCLLPCLKKKKSLWVKPSKNNLNFLFSKFCQSFKLPQIKSLPSSLCRKPSLRSSGWRSEQSLITSSISQFTRGCLQGHAAHWWMSGIVSWHQKGGG